MKQWTAARPHYCHSPHCLKERQREAKRLLSTEEPREDGDKGPKLNKCRKAAWRASPWSYALNERERLQGYPIWVFQWGDHTDTLHASIQLNYGSVHTGAPVHAHVLCPFGMCGRVHLKLVAFLSNPLHKKRPDFTLDPFPFAVLLQTPQHVGHLRKTRPLHINFFLSISRVFPCSLKCICSIGGRKGNPNHSIWVACVIVSTKKEFAWNPRH